MSVLSPFARFVRDFADPVLSDDIAECPRFLQNVGDHRFNLECLEFIREVHAFADLRDGSGLDGADVVFRKPAPSRGDGDVPVDTGQERHEEKAAHLFGCLWNHETHPSFVRSIVHILTYDAAGRTPGACAETSR